MTPETTLSFFPPHLHREVSPTEVRLTLRASKAVVRALPSGVIEATYPTLEAAKACRLGDAKGWVSIPSIPTVLLVHPVGITITKAKIGEEVEVEGKRYAMAGWGDGGTWIIESPTEEQKLAAVEHWGNGRRLHPEGRYAGPELSRKFWAALHPEQ